MSNSGIERNKLDYIITDILPVEISNNFSFVNFYNFLALEKNVKLQNIGIENLKIQKLKAGKIFEDKAWATHPLKFPIKKGEDSYRELSIIHPISALNIYYFMECYEKDILNLLEENDECSIRYHKKNTELYYKCKKDNYTEYYQESWSLDKRRIENMGNFYNVGPCPGLPKFTESQEFLLQNIKYSHYAKLDYKNCFDSIYTHSYKWITERSIVDSKNVNNSSLLVIIDRLLQNINGKSSNGIVVGPEFSRMIAEILLQHIDKQVITEISKVNKEIGYDYKIFRYVDDIFIFAKNEELINAIMRTYKLEANNFRLSLNEMKISKGLTPLLPKKWIFEISDIMNKIEGLCRGEFKYVNKLKCQIMYFINDNKDDKKTIIAYLISAMYRNIKKEASKESDSQGNIEESAMNILDVIMYIYSWEPMYNQTQNIIASIYYLNKFVDFKNNEIYKEKLQIKIKKYNYIFAKDNIYDTIDWLVIFSEYGIQLDIQIEKELVQEAEKLNDPIIWANILLYSQYNSNFTKEIVGKINNIIIREMGKITVEDSLLYREYWYLLIFHNCPYISDAARHSIEHIIKEDTPILSAFDNNLKLTTLNKHLLYKFLNIKDTNGQKNLFSFFNWSSENCLGEWITFKTHQRSIFKDYKHKSQGFTDDTY